MFYPDCGNGLGAFSRKVITGWFDPSLRPGV